MTHRSTDFADDLVKKIAKEGDASGVLANDLLREFFHGYPLDNLRPLLLSRDPSVLRPAAWIVQELGSSAQSLLADVTSLLHSDVPYVRYLATNSILTCATANDGAAVAAVIELINDEDPNVRWGVNQFLMRSNVGQLRAAESHLMLTEGKRVLANGLHALIESEKKDDEFILALLRSGEALLQRFGLAAALRRPEPSNAIISALRDAGAEIRMLGEEELKNRVCEGVE